MIIKRGMTIEGLEPYVQEDRTIRAKRMTEDFIYETGKGWNQGHRGDWLVLIEGDLWDAVEHEQFTRIYKPVAKV